MKITKNQLRRIIKEEKASLVSEGRWDRRRKERDQMAAQMTFNQLRNSAYETASFIQNRFNTGLYEEEDMWGDGGEVNRLADTVDAAKIKAAEEGITFDDVPDVRMANGGLLDLSYYSLGLPAGIKESKMKITKRQLRRIIKEAVAESRPISEISIAPLDALEVLRAITTVVGIPALLKKSSPDTYDKINNVLDKARPVGNAVTAATGIATGDVKGTAAQAVVAALSDPRVSGAIRDRAPDVYDKAVDVVDKAQKARLGSNVVNTLTRTSL